MSDDGRMKRSTHVLIANVEKEVSVLRGDVAETKDDVSELKQSVTANEASNQVRFTNGRKVMAEMKSDVADLKPKAPDWQKLLLAGFTVVALLMGGQLWITEALNKRVTQTEMEKRLLPIENAQKRTAEDIRDLAQAQSAQDEKLNNIQGSLDILIQHLPVEPTRKLRQP
jgi:predicted  nucleic acid-binding Zn-ribbon protein